MKVYASIESERASKGQGGNKYLDINLFGGTSKKSVPIGSLYLHVLDLEDEEEYNGTTTAIEIVFVSSEGGIQYQEIIKLNTKGEKLKTAKYHHDIGNQYNGVKCSDTCPIHRIK